MAAIAPTSRKTTAATAFSLMKKTADGQMGRPVVVHVRKCAARRSRRVGGGATSVAMLFDDDAPGHHVMSDAAEFVADDLKLPGRRRRERQHVVVARQNLEVHVHGQQRESVLQVRRGD